MLLEMRSINEVTTVWVLERATGIVKGHAQYIFYVFVSLSLVHVFIIIPTI